jgi:hypothetical protein
MMSELQARAMRSSGTPTWSVREKGDVSGTVSTIMMTSCHTWIYEFGSSFHANLKAAKKESGSVDCMAWGRPSQSFKYDWTGRFRETSLDVVLGTSNTFYIWTTALWQSDMCLVV